MIQILSMDNDFGIGYNNQLLYHIPDDLKYFKEKTLNSVVIMGRKTFESLPNQKPLINRVNIVLTRDKNYKANGIIVVNSIDELLEELKKHNNLIFVMGGEKIYKTLYKYTNKVYITKIENIKKADSFYLDIDNDKDFILKKQSETFKYKDIKYKFLTYQRIKGGIKWR